MAINLCMVCFEIADESIVNEFANIIGFSKPIELVVYKKGNDLLDSITNSKLVHYKFNDWVIVVFDSSLCFDESFTEKLSKLSFLCNIFMCSSQSATGGLWFEYHQQGHLQRQWIEIEGRVVSDIGEPIPAELDFISKDSHERDERDLFELVSIFLGFDINELF